MDEYMDEHIDEYMDEYGWMWMNVNERGCG